MRHQTNAHSTAGAPSITNISRQPQAWIRYPDTTDIHSTVTGLPSTRKVLARERSLRVNQLLIKISIAGITAASTMPSDTRMIINIGILVTSPVAMAHKPHRIRLQNTSLRTLYFCA